MNKLDIKAFAFAVAVTWALGVLLLGIISMFGWGEEAVRVLGSVYIGYAPTVTGTIVGTLWGLIDGALAAAVAAFLYNKLVSVSS